MDTETLRNAFLTFTDAATFRRFTTQLRRDAPDNSQYGRQRDDTLRYWQEQLWTRFNSEHPSAPTDMDSIRAALLWCNVHNTVLVDGHGFMADGICDTPGFTDALELQFPFGYGYWNIICPTCVKTCADWVHVNAPDSAR